MGNEVKKGMKVSLRLESCEVQEGEADYLADNKPPIVNFSKSLLPKPRQHEEMDLVSSTIEAGHLKCALQAFLAGLAQSHGSNFNDLDWCVIDLRDQEGNAIRIVNL